MPGLSHDGGPLIEGWDHVRQSVADILRTPIGSRVLRRDYGSRLLDLIDAPATDRAVLALWVATAEALERWEPRFELSNLSLARLDAEEMAQGRVSLLMTGTYYPRGHLGDFTPAAAPPGAFAVYLR